MDESGRGRAALVTGASAGIGRAVARALAGEGFDLALVARGRERLETVCAEIESQHGVRAIALAADLGDPAAPARVIDDALDALGRLDVLVNNAGTGRLVPIDQTDDALLDETFSLNTFAPARLIARAWPALARAGGSCIVNISSYAALDPLPGFFVYGAAKAALESMTRSCANEGREHAIRACTIAPGAVETDLLRSIVDEQVMPASACLRPEEVGALVLRCVHAEEASWDGATVYARRADDGAGMHIEVRR